MSDDNFIKSIIIVKPPNILPNKILRILTFLFKITLILIKRIKSRFIYIAPMLICLKD